MSSSFYTLSAHGDLWWRNFVSFSGKLLGREIKRYKRERESELRKGGLWEVL
jgi:hypothetical protein